jgi:hypothetical protein
MKKKWSGLIIILVLLVGCNSSLAGSIIVANCEACGYDSGNLFLFGGKSNFKTVCQFPGYCPEKKSLVLINLMADRQETPACSGGEPTPYTDPKLIQNPGTRTIASWNLPEPWKKQVILTDGNYFCPNCKTFHLHFRHTGFWD